MLVKATYTWAELSYAALGDLIVGNNLANLLRPWQPCLVVCLVGGAQLSEASIGAPKCEAATRGLGLCSSVSIEDLPQD